MEDNHNILDLPETPTASARYAGFWERFAAALIDGLIVGLPSYFISQMFVPNANEIALMDPEEVQGMLGPMMMTNLVMWLVQGLYYAYFESSERRGGFGKQALGLQVTNLDGGRISFLNAYGRYFAKILSVITLLIGYIMQPFTQRKQALHDLVAGTLVVKAER